MTDVSALASLTNLTTLFLNSTQVSDVRSLASLTNLTWLYLDSTKVSAEQVKALQEKLPQCKISQ